MAILIVAIALCVRGGGHLITLVSRLILEFQSIGSLSTVMTMSKISVWTVFLADVGLLAGYIVAIVAPGRGASKAFAITCVSVCTVSTALMFFVVVMPTIDATSSSSLASAFGFSFLSGGGSVFIAVMKRFLVTVLFVAHIPLFVFYLKNASRNSSSMVPFFIFLGWVGDHLIQAIFLLIMSKMTIQSRAPIYLLNTLDWIGIVCFTVFLVFAIINAFQSRQKA